MSISETKQNDLVPPILLLEERLVVHLNRHKIGEVVIRKEVETQIIEVPVRREKLVVEQIAPTYKKIAIIDLGTDISLVNIPVEVIDKSCVFVSEFESSQLAIQFLQAIANLPVESTSLKIEIKVNNEATKGIYQELLKDFLN